MGNTSVEETWQMAVKSPLEASFLPIGAVPSALFSIDP
jgi:hypothetical protein